MSNFSGLEISAIPHFSPLHYLPFIAKSRSLMSKQRLQDTGFSWSHFRTKSKNTDVKRGFGEYVFLTLSQNPRIVQAKLNGGFPHIALQVPASTLNAVSYDLCRYNVAMVRRTTDSPKGGFPESDTNGRYYDGKKLPIARTKVDKINLVEEHYYNASTMIEVLVPNELQLPDHTEINCYNEDDATLCMQVLEAYEVPWKIRITDPPGPYNRKPAYVTKVQNFLIEALANPEWRGNGLEYDRV